MPDPRKLQVFCMTPTATLPRRGSEGAVGYDLSADIWLSNGGSIGSSGSVAIAPGDRLSINTGIAMAIPHGYMGHILPRSGLAKKNGIVVLGGVIDPDYRGELLVMLLNTGSEPLPIKHGDRIAQIVLKRVATPEIDEVFRQDELGETVRGTAGFGSTGMAA